MERDKDGFTPNEMAKTIAAGSVGTGTAIGALSAVGIPGLSGAGITSGLAVLGAGSMLAGIGTVAAIGYVSYRISKFGISKIADVMERDQQ